MSKIQIDVADRNGKQHSLFASPGGTLMNALRSAGLPIAAICGGAMSCATCHVYVKDGYERVGIPDEDEIDLLSESEHYREGISRLSCQIEILPSLAGLCVELAAESV